jgi:hypothetical protein
MFTRKFHPRGRQPLGDDEVEERAFELAACHATGAGLRHQGPHDARPPAARRPGKDVGNGKGILEPADLRLVRGARQGVAIDHGGQIAERA